MGINKMPYLRPIAIAQRWRSLCIIECLTESADSESIDPQDRCSTITYTNTDGLINACCAANSYARLRINFIGAVYYGGNLEHPEYGEAAITWEQNARAKAAGISPDLPGLFPKPLRKTMGWTYAMWCSIGGSMWEDLTGVDPDCSECLKFEFATALLGTEDEAVEWMAEQYELAHAREAIRFVLREEPLSRLLVAQFSQESSLERILRRADAAGYPVLDSLRS